MKRNVTNTVIESEYREAAELHGEESAFKVLKELYHAEKERLEK